MDCVRCRISDTTDTIQNGMLKNRVEVDCIESNSEGYQSGQNIDDIGGFAEISGLHMLKSSQKQVGSPSEEDLLNWAHHSSFHLPLQFLMFFFKLQLVMRSLSHLQTK